MRTEKQPRQAISAVVPVFNEEDNLVELDGELRTVLANMGLPAEIIYVDDRSTDRSYEVLGVLLERYRHDHVATRVLRLRRNFGQTAALAAGFEVAVGNTVVALDADGQNNPIDIPRLVNALDEGYDVVSGWRRHRRDSWFRTLSSRMANRLIGWVSGVPLHDYGCTLKAYRKALLSEVHLYGEMHRFIPLYVARQGGRVTELEVDHRPRRQGKSKYGSRRVFKVGLDLVLILFMSRYFSRPMHFFGQVALLFAAAFLAVGVTMIGLKFGWLTILGLSYRADFVETPLPALAAIFLAAAILSLFFGILGELLIRIYFELQGLRPFLVETIDEEGRSSRFVANE